MFLIQENQFKKILKKISHENRKFFIVKNQLMKFKIKNKLEILSKISMKNYHKFLKNTNR